MVTHEQWDKFTQTDYETWEILFKRQSKLLKNAAADEIKQGMDRLAICASKIPKFSELNTILNQETGFSIVPVKGFIPEDLFFKFLSERKFPATCFIRKPHQMDYLEKPDIFHDVFGHIPLLVNPIFADFMQAFGVKGLEAIDLNMLKFAATLYWYTVEFGLINTLKGLRIYGAGIISSKGESLYALKSNIPARIRFNRLQAMKIPYAIDTFQKTYFVIESFEQLFHDLHTLEWQEMRESLGFSETINNLFTNNEE